MVDPKVGSLRLLSSRRDWGCPPHTQATEDVRTTALQGQAVTRVCRGGVMWCRQRAGRVPWPQAGRLRLDTGRSFCGRCASSAVGLWLPYAVGLVRVPGVEGGGVVQGGGDRADGAGESGRATLMGDLAEGRRWLKYETFRTQFERAARDLAGREEEKALEAVTVSERQFRRWLSGRVKSMPLPDSSRVLEHMFGFPIRELLRPAIAAADETSKGSTTRHSPLQASLLESVTVRPEAPGNDQERSDIVEGQILGSIRVDSPEVPVSVLVQASTADAGKITTSAGSDLIDPLAMEQFFDEVRRLAIVYIESTAGIDHYILKRATELRGDLQALTAAYRDPSQSADLYLMIGLLSAICSQACLDLGYPDEAVAQARASFMMGELVGHDGLRAWVLGTRSLIARFQGRYDEALSAARRGLQYATSGTALVRLRCGEGQTLSHLGDAASAINALNLAKDARERVNSTDITDGLFAFSEAKQTYYSGSSLQWLPGEKNAKASEAESSRAIRMFQESNPGTSSGDELLAHVYLSNSRLTLGELEGSMQALRPVLDLPVPERNAWQRKRMRQIASRLQRASFADSQLALSARDEISSFTEAPSR
jgi:tetratricopeptide (TPR) repeat protein